MTTIIGGASRGRGALTVAMALVAGLFSPKNTGPGSGSVNEVIKENKRHSLSRASEYEARKIRQGLKWFTVNGEKVLALNRKNAENKYARKFASEVRHKAWLAEGLDFVMHEGKMYKETKPRYITGVDPVPVKLRPAYTL